MMIATTSVQSVSLSNPRHLWNRHTQWKSRQLSLTRRRSLFAEALKDDLSGQETSSQRSDRSYINFTGFPFPLGPYLQRQTMRYEVIKGQIWTFEQPQSLGFSSVSINIRMTVIKLRTGGLWIHAPIAPTKECVRLVKELNAPVEYIILPTFAYEHKIFVGPFSRRFPKAKVFVAPSQWSWPINLPPQLFGIFPVATLKNEDTQTPWSSEIEQKVFRPPDIGIGPYVECVFFHKPTRTMLVTDLVVYIPQEPIEVIPPKYLLDLAQNDGLNTFIAGDLTPEEIEARTDKTPVEDTRANRRRGWARSVLLVLYFQPFNLLEPDTSFDAVKEKWLVSPVLRSLVYDSIPKSCVEFVLSVERDWDFNKIIPCHLAGPVAARRGDLSGAFGFSFEAIGAMPPSKSLPIIGSFFNRGRASEAVMRKDNGTLDGLISFLRKIGAVYDQLE